MSPADLAILAIKEAVIKNKKVSQQSCNQGNFPFKKICPFIVTQKLAELMSAELR